MWGKMPIISVRVSRELKEKMDRLKHIRWSEVIRQAIIDKINQEEKRSLAKAVLLTERIRNSVPPGGDTTEIIRYWREKRYAGEDCA